MEVEDMQAYVQQQVEQSQAAERMAPVLAAAEAGDVATMVAALEQLGCEIDAPGEDGDTALHMGCLYGHEAVVAECVRRGACVTARDEDNSTPLHDACAGGFHQIAVLLLERGAQVDARDNDGDTPLHLAVNGGHAHVANLLLERAGGQAALLAIANEAGQRPVDLAEDPALMAALRLAGGEAGDDDAAGSNFKKTRN
jgi:ankyrin repeat protein